MKDDVLVVRALVTKASDNTQTIKFNPPFTTQYVFHQ
jgi:hypothetical protein